MVPIYNKQMRERFVEASGDCDAAAPTAQQNNSAKQNETSKQIRIRGVSHFQGWNWTRVPNNKLTLITASEMVWQGCDDMAGATSVLALEDHTIVTDG